MTITENKTANSLELVISGRLDTGTAPELEAKLKQVAKDIQTLYLNMQNVQYISSAGLRVLVGTEKKLKPEGIPFVIKVNDAINEILVMSGFDKILNLE